MTHIKSSWGKEKSPTLQGREGNRGYRGGGVGKLGGKAPGGSGVYERKEVDKSLTTQKKHGPTETWGGVGGQR